MNKLKLSKIKQLLNFAHTELDKYKKNESWGHLSQACEKTWVAFVLTLEYLSDEEIYGSKKRIELAKKLNLMELYQTTNKFHIIHYEGVKEDESLLFEEIEDAIHRIKGLL